jgi:predicted permease
MDTISRRLEAQYPADDKGWGAVVIPMNQDLVGEVRTALLVLFGAVAFVLLIACANVANLVLARTISRQREVAIRTALGASRTRLLRQIISETVLLSLLGGVLGIGVAYGSIRFIVSSAAAQLPRSSEISLSVPVLVFAFGVSVLAGILAGLLPALRMSKTNVNDALKQGTRASSDVGGNRTRGVLVVSEVALSLMLLIGAGLMIRSLWMLHRVDPGFDSHNVIAVMPSISRKTFQTPTQQIAFYNEVLGRVRSLPGVQAAGSIDDLPLSGGGSVQPVQLEGRPVQQMADQPEVSVRGIIPGYFKAMHIPLIRGRELGEQDVASAPGAIVISAAMAKRLWPNEDPIGKHLTMYFFPNRNREVVGIVGDVKDNGLNGAADATLYVPFAQLEQPPAQPFRSFPIWIVLRASANAASLVPAITAAIHQVNPELPVLGSSTLDEVVGNSLSQQRFSTLLLGIFAALALFLAAIGIYSVLAYSVRRRVREIGIRMALGAQIKDVLQMVILEGMKPTLLGLAIGIVGALAVGRLLSSMIYGVKSTDLLTFISVSAGLLGVGVLASIIPAYRATRIEPVKTLRDE